MSFTAWAAIAIFAVAYVFIATEKVHRVAAALGGATLMLLIGATDAEHAFFSDVGASANVVILGLAERAGRRISFWEFTKYGLVVTVVTIALCMPYLWLRYFVLA